MRKLKAFTLVDLLVVISIIAFLTAVLMPALGKTRDQSRIILCASNLKTIGMADQMYSEVEDDWHVPAYYRNTFLPAEPPIHLWFQNPLFFVLADLKGRDNEEEQDIFEEEAMAMTPQLKDFYCPNDKRTVENGGLYVGPEGVAEGSSYAMNIEGLRPNGHWLNDIVYALKVPEVVNPAEKIFFMDGQWFAVYIEGAEYKRIWDVYGDRMGDWEWDSASYRHDEGANIAFYDGHVAYWKKERICPYLPDDHEERLAREAIWLPIPEEYFP